MYEFWLPVFAAMLITCGAVNAAAEPSDANNPVYATVRGGGGFLTWTQIGTAGPEFPGWFVAGEGGWKSRGRREWRLGGIAELGAFAERHQNYGPQRAKYIGGQVAYGVRRGATKAFADHVWLAGTSIGVHWRDPPPERFWAVMPSFFGGFTWGIFNIEIRLGGIAVATLSAGVTFDL